MKNKKDIEHIFQEKLGDFEANPPQESWDFISEKINEKEEKRRIILVMVGRFFFRLFCFFC